MMEVIQLKYTAIDDLAGDHARKRWYFGCGMANLALLAGKPVGLVYDESGIQQQPTMADLPAHDEIRHGMVSCWEFLPE